MHKQSRSLCPLPFTLLKNITKTLNSEYFLLIFFPGIRRRNLLGNCVNTFARTIQKRQRTNQRRHRLNLPCQRSLLDFKRRNGLPSSDGIRSKLVPRRKPSRQRVGSDQRKKFVRHPPGGLGNRSVKQSLCRLLLNHDI